MREAYSYRSDPSVPAFADDKPVIIFDGHCVFCSAWARFVLRVDRKGRYRLLPAQSKLGEALYVHYGLDPREYESNILLKDGHAYFKADGSIRMAQGLGFLWSMAVLLRILPGRWNDALYDLVARNRYRVFGRSDVCYAPQEKYRDRFLG
jgi:predicted DCC family thiol-disulfide oxidoreductase YuxK